MSETKRYFDRHGNLRQRRTRSHRGSTQPDNLFVTPPDEARKLLRELIEFINTPTPTEDK